MIPRGAIYHDLRTKMLQQFSRGSKATYGESKSIGDWLSKGSLVVTSSTKKHVVFEAPVMEFGSTLLSEVENYFNHCFEHLQELGCVAVDQRVRSRAWHTVTAYYFAFFASAAVLRLLGRPVVFLLKDQLRLITGASGFPQIPSQGSFELTMTKQISVTHAEFLLKSTSKVHEATWLSLLGLLQSYRQKHALTDVSEAVFYDSICTTALFQEYVNYQWPSSIRNRANYRPGYIYALKIAKDQDQRLISGWSEAVTSDITNMIASAEGACRSASKDFHTQVRLLVAVGISIFLLGRELYSDLFARISLDKRWENARKDYRKHMVFSQEQYKILTQTF